MWGFTFAIKFMLIFIYIRRLFYKVKLPFIHFKQKEHAKCIRFRFQLSLLRRFCSWISFETIPYEVGGKIHKVKSRLLVLIKDPHRNMGVFIWYIRGVISHLYYPNEF